MVYFINEHLKYDSLSSTLYSPENNPDTISLSRVSNSILLLFITNNNKLLTREFLLNEVWERQGVDSSNNNLNNHISILRKSLSQCGGDELITTIAKQGLMFNANSITTISPHENLQKCTHGDQTEINHRLLAELVTFEGNPKVYFFKYLLVPILILATISLPILYENIRLSLSRDEVFRVEKCVFYLTDDDTRSGDRNDIIKRMGDFLKKENIDCSHVKSNIYFFLQKSKNAVGQKAIRQLISYCPYSGSAQCINYQENSAK